MKKEPPLKHLQQEIREYFYTIYKYEHISLQETEQCLNAYLKYLLLKNNVDTNSINTVIHKVREKNLDLSETAKMTIDGNLFEIFLNRAHFSIDKISKLENISRLFISHGHEIQHIIQYVKAYKMMFKYDEHLLNLIDIASKYDLKYSPRQNKKLVNKLTNLYASNLLLSRVELNAVYRSFENFENLINDIIAEEEIPSFKNFLYVLLEQFDYIKNYENNNIRKLKITAQQNMTSLETLKHMLTEEELKEVYIF